MRHGFFGVVLVAASANVSATAIAGCSSFGADDPAVVPPTEASAPDAGGEASPSSDGGCENQGLAFHGSEWLTVLDANDLDDIGAMTVEAWIAFDPTGLMPSATDVVYVFSHQHVQAMTGYSMFVDGNGLVALKIWNGMGAQTLPGTAQSYVRSNAFTHVAVTYDPGVRAVTYIDGQLRAEKTDKVYTTIADDTGELRIGNLVSDSTRGFRGIIDSLRISKGVRYVAAFPKLTAPFVVDGPTIALWSFDEGKGDTARDAKGKHVATMPATQANRPQWKSLPCLPDLAK